MAEAASVGGLCHLPMSPIDPSPTSPLWHPGHAHALIDALAPGEVSRIVARYVGAEAADGESRIERKPRLDRGPRLVKPTEMRQRGGEIEMRDVDDFG